MTKKISVEFTRLSADDEVESAKILFQEGLDEEAKKILFQVLLHQPDYRRARTLLQQIQNKEEQQLLNRTSPTPNRTAASEDTDLIIQQLNGDLGLGMESSELNPEQENWSRHDDLNAQARYDLGVAYFEMGCFSDAARELKAAERLVRLEQTFLGAFGVSIVALYGECLLELDKAFEAKVHLDPILTEPDLKLEEKVVLFYVMGRVESALAHPAEAKGWFQKVLEVDSSFRDVRKRLAQFKR